MAAGRLKSTQIPHITQEAISVVEGLSGRRVVASMSNNRIDPDLAVEIFALQRAPDGRQSDESLNGHERLR